MIYKFEETAIYQGGNNRYWRLWAVVIYCVIPGLFYFLLQSLLATLFKEYYTTSHYDLLKGDNWELIESFPLPYWSNKLLISGSLDFTFLLFFKIAYPQRTLVSLVNKNNQINWREILYGILIYFLVKVSFELIFLWSYKSFYSFKENNNYNFGIFVLVLFTVFMRAVSEEVIFRGYLLQSFYALTKNKIATIIIVAALFGLSHNYGYFPVKDMLYHGLVGLILTVIVFRTHSIEYSIGIHFISNLWVLFSRIGMTRKVEIEINSLDFFVITRSLNNIIPLFFVLLLMLIIYKNKKE